MEMRTARTNAIAGTLVFFGLLAPQAVAAQPQSSDSTKITALDVSKCTIIVIGRHRTCPKFVEPGTVQVLLTEEQYKALENLPPATKKDIEEARKKLESAP